MGEDTQKVEKEQGKTRAWVERHLGRVILASVPVLMIALSGWIFNIEGKIAKIEGSNKENAAQWKALYESKQNLQDLQIEVAVYQKLFKMLLDQKKIDVTNVTMKAPKVTTNRLPRALEEFKREQIQQVPNQMLQRRK